MSEATRQGSNCQNPSNLLDTMINLVDRDEIHSIIDCQRQMLVSGVSAVFCELW